MSVPEFDLGESINRWVLAENFTPEDGNLIQHLRETVLTIARAHLASGPTVQAPQHCDAEDLAMEFLLNLRSRGNWMIRTKSGLTTEYRRWVTGFNSPAQHELWEIVSTALHGLARENTAWRLDASANEDNDNDAVWTGVAGEAGGMACDLVAFEQTARRIRNYPPPAARRWVADDEIQHKVIAPKDAKALTLSLLQAAGGAIRFRDLLEEFKRHVFAFDLVGEPSTQHEDDSHSVHPAAMKRAYELAHQRAAEIWDVVAGIEGTDLLCDYFIAKHLGERAVTLEGFGDPRRVHERMKRLVEILRHHLALNVAEAPNSENDDVNSAFRRSFTLEAMHILCEKCRCRSGKAKT